MRTPSEELQEVLKDIIEGRIVKRAKHDLTWETRDVSIQFIDVLAGEGYIPAIVKGIDIQPGERVPAFYIDGTTAYFGWVFWEKFSQLKLRKLFGSIVRNSKGDWAIQIPEQRNTIIYANINLRSEMDIESPSGF